MDLELAINFLSNDFFMAVREKGDDENMIIFSRTMHGSEAHEMLYWIEYCLESSEMGSLKDVRYFTLGIGPGGFSGLRITSAVFSGLTFQRKNIYVRGVPSLAAVFDSIPEDAENPAVLFDGRRKDIFCFTSPDQREPEILKEPDEIDKFDYVYALMEHKGALQSFFKEKLSEIVMLESFPADQLLESKKDYISGEDIDYFYEDLIYLRPPV